jgi:hypothetical protein
VTEVAEVAKVKEVKEQIEQTDRPEPCLQHLSQVFHTLRCSKSTLPFEAYLL